MQKTCNKCNETKDITNFAKNKTRKDGYNNICKSCFKLYRDQHYKDNKAYYKDKAKNYRKVMIEGLNEFKSTLKCEICGESRVYCLDFHHIDPNQKDGNISNLIRSSNLDKVKEEISKCKVLCANCHRELHYKEKHI